MPAVKHAGRHWSSRLPFYYGWVVIGVAFVTMAIGVTASALASLAVDRACACLEAGADMIFPEAITELSMYKKFADAVKVPILANITEFGQTPLFTVKELAGANVAMALYPLSAVGGGGADAIARRALLFPRLSRLRGQARRAFRPRQEEKMIQDTRYGIRDNS